MDAMRHMLQMLGEFERAGRCIDRVAVDHHQRVDGAGRHVGASAPSVCVSSIAGRDRLAVPDGCADIVQLLVDRRRERLPMRIELRPDGEERAPGMGAQLADRAVEPALLRRAELPAWSRPVTANCAPIACASAASREAIAGQPSGGDRAGQARDAFGDVKARAALARRDARRAVCAHAAA